MLLPAALAGAAAVALVLWRPELGVALALALAPLTNLQLGGAKPVQVLLPGLAGALLVYSFLAPRTAAGRAAGGFGTALLAFSLSVLASSAQAVAPAESVKKVTIVLTAAAIFVAVTQFCGTWRRLGVAVGGALAGLLVAGLQGLGQNYLGTAGEGFVAGGELIGRVQGSFGHPNQYGGYLALLLPLAVAVLFTRGLGPLRGLAAAAAAAGLPALILSYARGAIGGAVLGSLVWLAAVRPRAAVFVAALVAAVGVWIAPGALRERLDPGSSREDVPLRADIWGAALDIYGTRPLLGVGVSNFAVAYDRLPSTQALASQRRFLNEEDLRTPPHAHNLYLNVLAEQGLVGLTVLLWLLGAAVVVFHRASRGEHRLLRAAGLGGGAGLAAILLHSLLEVTLYSELVLPLFGLAGVAAVGLGLERQRRSAEDAPVSVTSAEPLRPPVS